LTLYTIEVTRGDFVWKVERRYSDFVRLDRNLSCALAEVFLPVLPPKGFLGFRKTFNVNGFRQHRLQSLQQYLDDVVALVDEGKAPEDHVHAFFGVQLRFQGSGSATTSRISYHLMEGAGQSSYHSVG